MPPKRKSWDKDNMIRAINAVRRGQMGYLRASKFFGVPKGTLENYSKADATPEALVSLRIGRRPALPDQLETELARYCLELDQRFYGLRTKDIKYMAFQLAIKNNLKHPFNVEKGCAGKKWLRGFLRRHPNLSTRTPEAVSAARIKGFNPDAVQKFFDLYEPQLEKIQFSPHRLYNVDETGITVVQHQRSKVISMKGKKQVGTLTSLERGKLITVVTCMNACGGYVPPLIIFPRKNMAQDLMDGAPAGSIGDCHPSGWIQTHLFTRWFHHFISFTKPTRDDPILLILDGHYTHTRNVEVIDLARENYITIVCLPPHCTHKMQPTDVAFMKPLKTYYAQEIETWLRNHPGRTLNNKYVTRLFGLAYEKAATMSNSVNGFRKSGLFPCNRNIFTEQDFLIFNEGAFEQSTVPDNREGSPSLLNNPGMTEIQEEQCKTPPLQISHDPSAAGSNNEDQEPGIISVTADSNSIPVPNISTASKSNEGPITITNNEDPIPSTSSYTSPFTIKPVPRLPNNDSGKKTRSGSATVITASPYKQALQTSIEKKKEKESKKGKKKSANKETKKQLIKKKGKKIIKKRKVQEPNSSSSDENNLPEDINSSSDDESCDVECPYCNGRFSEDTRGEKWVQCQACYKWAHEDCGEAFADGRYLCSLCSQT